MAKSKKKSGILIKTLMGFNILLILLTLLSYLSPFIDPVYFWIIAFLGLAFPLFILMNFLFLILWLLIRWKYALFSFITISLGIFFVFSNIQYHKKIDVKSIKGKIKVMSYNVRIFDLYNYNKDKSLNFSGRNNIFSLLKEEDPDIICFQEYYWDSTNAFNTTDTLTSFLSAKHNFCDFPVVLKNIHHFGIASFSKYPILNKGVIHFPNNPSESAIWIDVLKEQDTIRVFNAHLESIRLGKEDQVFLTNLANVDNTNFKSKQTFKGLLLKFKTSFQKRSEQSRILAESIQESPYPVIVCSDFNDTPVSYTYHTVSKNLFDAFKKSGSGFGNSYNGFYPSFRIDYILYSSFFKSYNYTTIQKNYSDHYPVYCYIAPVSQNN
ncbi:MAG: endonuclease/exonuclease/phosphatase family protein [Bacteroidota bacterium]